KKQWKFADLGSLVATVEGISVAPDETAEVQGTRLHRPAQSETAQTQAAGAATPAPSNGRGIVNFLVAALLLFSLAAWLVRQIGPLKD
ncbi:MAG: hypothetical protein ACRDLB_12120, partial [Actinomycetota bacterium]